MVRSRHILLVRSSICIMAIFVCVMSRAERGDAALAPCPPTEYERRTLVQMFGLADHHNLKLLMAMHDRIRSRGDRILSDNYAVALYIADNNRFRMQFVRNFPTDLQGFLSFGCAIGSWSNGARVLFPYKTLVRYALTGDKDAIRKALLVETDGIVAEYMTDYATLIASKFPHTSLQQLGSTTEVQRNRVICYNLDDWYRRAEFDRFLATKPASSAEAALLKDLNAINRGCAKPLPSHLKNRKGYK